MKNNFFCYLIKNKINKKSYVGITSNTIESRWRGHVNEAKINRGKYRSCLHSAIRKYGENEFEVTKLKSDTSWDKICDWEVYFIKKYKTKVPDGYNLTDGGEGAYGYKQSKNAIRKMKMHRRKDWKNDEYRAHQRQKMKERWNDPNEIKLQSKRSSMLWKNDEYREKTSNAIKKAFNNPETKEKLKKVAKMEFQNPEIKEKHRQGLIKATRENPEWMKRNKEKNQRLAKDPEHIKKCSEAAKIKFQNPEMKEKHRKAVKKSWENNKERRKKHAEEMRNIINKNLNDPEYWEWRKENPPGGKPTQYRRKIFRSIQEATKFFGVPRSKVDRDILKGRRACKKLDPNKKYDFEIKYK